MAFYSSNYHEGDLSEYSLTPYYEPSQSLPFQGSLTSALAFDEDDPDEFYPLTAYQDSYISKPFQDSFTYSDNFAGYENNPAEDHPLVLYYNGYNSTPYPDSLNYHWNDEFNQNRISLYYQPANYTGNDDDDDACWSRISYSASALSEPKYITLYGESPDFYSAETHFLISYDVSDFNEPEFEEYDPKPYGGGYDIAATYGKPLSPSEETCYPRSGTLPAIPNPAIPPVMEEENPPSQVQSTNEETAAKILPPIGDDSQGKPEESGQSEEEELQNEKKGNGNDNGVYEGKETVGENGSYDDYERQTVPHQVPSGYGLEAMDICESLFGPWPCLTRNYRQACKSLQDEEDCGYGRRRNQWNDAADYLFGSSCPYGQTTPYRGDNVHAYHKHNYQEDPLHHQQVTYVYNTWSE